MAENKYDVDVVDLPTETIFKGLIRSLCETSEKLSEELDDEKSIDFTEKMDEIKLLLDEVYDILDGAPVLNIPKEPEGDFVWVPIKEA